MSCRRLGQSAAALAVAVLLAFAGFSLATTEGHAASSAGLGVYRGAAAPGQVSAFGTWLGRNPTYALDYFAGTSWSTIESPDWWLNAWSGAPYAVEYSVPLIPDTGGSMQEGATGAYNTHFQKLAQTLLAHGQGNAILRLGWEFNGNWYKWYAGNDPGSFVGYWRQIVTTMRAVAPNLRFDWCPTLGAGNMSTGVEAAYPGDAYVDYIGADVYDQSWGSNYKDPGFRWNEFMTEKNGLNWLASFAGAHGKPITIPEWGLSIRSDGHGGGDNTYFIQHMYDWINANNVAFQMYFEVDASDGAHRLMGTQFPQGAAAYRQLFAGAAPPASSSSSTSPTSTSAPTTSTVPSTTTSPAPPPQTTSTSQTTTTAPSTTTATTAPSTTTTTSSQPTKPRCRTRSCRGTGRTFAEKRVTRSAKKANAKTSRASCRNSRVVSQPPTWFWSWVRWQLGRGEFKGHAHAMAYRPRVVPRKIPASAWRQYARFRAGQSVAIRVCSR